MPSCSSLLWIGPTHVLCCFRIQVTGCRTRAWILEKAFRIWCLKIKKKYSPTNTIQTAWQLLTKIMRPLLPLTPSSRCTRLSRGSKGKKAPGPFSPQKQSQFTSKKCQLHSKYSETPNQVETPSKDQPTTSLSPTRYIRGTSNKNYAKYRICRCRICRCSIPHISPTNSKGNKCRLYDFDNR